MTQLETMLGVTPVPAENPFHLYLITPEIAAKLLSRKHPRNRKLKDGVVERYAKAMADGHWKDAISSQPISISADGFVQDGHHRLNAIIKATPPIICGWLKTLNRNSSSIWTTAKNDGQKTI